MLSAFRDTNSFISMLIVRRGGAGGQDWEINILFLWREREGEREKESERETGTLLYATVHSVIEISRQNLT